MNTPEVRAHLGGVDTPEKCVQRFERQRDSWTDENGGWLAIARRADGELLGNCGFSPIDTEAAPEELRGASQIGWGLRADCWGRGYATEAALALLGQMFTRWNLPVVFAQTSDANRASWRVMEKLGMERRADLDYDDPDYPPEENPTVVYSLTRDTWEAARG